MIKHISTLILFFASSFVAAQVSDSTKIISADSSEINRIDTTIYETVDFPAVFPGGKSAWYKYLENNLNAAVPVENGAKTGTYNVIIKFVVRYDGTLSGFIPLTKYGRGMEEEVIRILKLSPKWNPAKRNGINVSSVTKLTQTFVVSKG